MWHDNETTLDYLGYQHFSNAITALTKEKRLLPVTVGLFGDWGSGKSSILKMLERSYSSDESVLCMRFDGWLFEGYDDAKAALMTDIIQGIKEKIKKDQTRFENIKKITKSLLKRVDWFRMAGLAAKGIVTLTSPLSPLTLLTTLLQQSPGLIEKFSSDPEKFKEELTSLIKPETSEVFDNIRQFRSEFENLISEAGLSSVVILIDDLDRCLPESIISTLEAIKLFLSVKGTAFVIAADERIIRHAINNRYPVDKYNDQDLSQDYLEKLIQIPITIPVLTEQDVACYMYMLFSEKALYDEYNEAFRNLYATVLENRSKKELPEPINYGIVQKVIGENATKLQTDFSLVEVIAPILTKGLDGNPRLIKRFLNAFSLRIEMGKAMKLELHENILCKLMILERFHIQKFKELFSWQAPNQGIAEKLNKLEKAVTNGTDEELTDEEKAWYIDDEIRNWLKIEPRLGQTCLSEYFHISRETIRISTKGSKQLPPDLQKIYANLQNKLETVRKNAAENLIKQKQEAINAVYDAIASKAFSASGNDAMKGLIEVALQNELLANRLSTDLKKIDPASLTGPIVFKIASLSTTYVQLKEQVDKLLVQWKDCPKKEISMAATRSLNPTLSTLTRSLKQRE